MIRAARILSASLFALILAPPGEKPDDSPKDGKAFGFDVPVVCSEITGFDNYVELPDAAITRDEKMLVYLRPRHFKTARVGKQYEAHLTEDVKIRRRGQKPVLWSKPRMVDYSSKFDQPQPPVALQNKIAIKGLEPGDYDLEITLHDEVGQGAPAVRVIPFKIVPAKGPADSKADEEAPSTRPQK